MPSYHLPGNAFFQLVLEGLGGNLTIPLQTAHHSDLVPVLGVPCPLAMPLRSAIPSLEDMSLNVVRAWHGQRSNLKLWGIPGQALQPKAAEATGV